MLAGALVIGLGCSSDDDDVSTPLEGDTAAEKVASLAKLRGCARPEIDPEKLPARCEKLAITWLDCVARDLDQCLCESGDNSLNCEGSYKANEGPARCIQEYGAYDDCVES